MECIKSAMKNWDQNSNEATNKSIVDSHQWERENERSWAGGHSYVRKDENYV